MAGFEVELAGRLIGEQQERPVRQGAGDCHPLLLAAGQLVRPMPGTVTEADHLEELGDAGIAGGRLGADESQRHLDVLRCGQDRNEAEGLEDEGDRPAPDLDEIVLGHRRDLLAMDDDAAARRSVEAPDEVQQRRLAAPGTAPNREQLAPVDREIDVLQGVDDIVAGRVVAAEGGDRHHPRIAPAETSRGGSGGRGGPIDREAHDRSSPSWPGRDPAGHTPT